MAQKDWAWELWQSSQKKLDAMRTQRRSTFCLIETPKANCFRVLLLIEPVNWPSF